MVDGVEDSKLATYARSCENCRTDLWTIRVLAGNGEDNQLSEELVARITPEEFDGDLVGQDALNPRSIARRVSDSGPSSRSCKTAARRSYGFGTWGRGS